MAAAEQSSTMRMHAARPWRDPSTLVLALSGRIARQDIPGLCEQARVMLEDSDAEVVICDLGALAAPDAVTVDALARLQLTARRLGRQLQLRRASGALQELLAFCGVCDVMPLVDELALEAQRQAKQREQPRGVEERVERSDPTV